MSSFGVLAAGIFFFILILWVRRNEDAGDIHDQTGILSMRDRLESAPGDRRQAASSAAAAGNPRTAKGGAAGESVEFYDPDEEIEIKEPLPF
ncbi:MAG: hypothetical protein Tsb0010_00970 [Parvularculaceae bacterium]